MLILIAVISCAVWLYLTYAHGGFWRADQHLVTSPEPPHWPSVAVVIPARNEAETIATVVSAHMGSDYPGALSVFVVDDQSSDGTGDLAAKAGKADSHISLNVIPGRPLPKGWSGKLWAMETGREAVQAAPDQADYVLFTDADIVHAPDLLRRLVARAEDQKLAMVSVMAQLDARGLWGGLFIPAFIFFFQKLYPFARVNDVDSETAGAAGGVVLLKRSALDAIGGLAPIKGALIDDCTLAQAVKTSGERRPIELVFAGEDAKSLRDNRSFDTVRQMVARTAFTQLGYSWAKLIGTVIGMALVYLAGPILLLTMPLHRDALAGLLGAIVWGMMIAAFAPTLRLYGKPIWQGVFLPLTALFYTGFTVDSAVKHATGKGGAWKGRTYPATEG